ncbi:hypothetical protein [Mesorhizobium sophorae]|uniref:hypothetical protein n=1 Tax=Mesorhizobium sophorae TaxID=1300294 RepID=UPI001180E487|nr:hypothetical protein [Mesorhizobium sophorae]
MRREIKAPLGVFGTDRHSLALRNAPQKLTARREIIVNRLRTCGLIFFRPTIPSKTVSLLSLDGYQCSATITFAWCHLRLREAVRSG